MRTRTSDRQQKYVEAARQLFFKHGYARVSMNLVATTVGGSKTTLYSYFHSKEALFRAFVLETGKEKFSRLANTTVDTDDIGKTLSDMAGAYLALACDPDVQRLDQLVHAESPRQPTLSRMYRNLTHTRTISTMAWTFEGLVFHRRIRNTSPQVLAMHFKALLDCIAVELRHTTDGPAPDGLMQTAIHQTVEAFLYGYQPPGAQAA